MHKLLFTVLIVPSIRRWRIDFKTSELVVGELTNMREVPAKITKSRKIRIVAGRRFWRFLLVNQLPLSIMAVHVQYRATAPLKIFAPDSATPVLSAARLQRWSLLLSSYQYEIEFKPSVEVCLGNCTPDCQTSSLCQGSCNDPKWLARSLLHHS